MSQPTPKPSRTPWIVAGVLGCLVVCLFLAVVGVGGYLLVSSSQAKPTAVVKVITATPAPVVSSKASSPQSSASSASSVASSVTSSVVSASSSSASVLSSVSASSSSSATALSESSSSAVSLPASSSSALSVVPSSSSASTKAATAPTGKIAFSKAEGDRPEDKYIWIMNADGTGAKKILDRASSPSFSPDGTKIAFFGWTEGVYVANIDGTNKTKVVGDSTASIVDWSHDGKLLAFSAKPGGGNVVIDVAPPDGSVLKDANQRRNVAVGTSPAWSPDDKTLVFKTCRANCGIFKGSVSGGDAIPLTTDDGSAPVWSPDGKKIVYQKEMDGQNQLFVINADGSGKKQLTQGPAMHVSANWSPDGNFIYYRTPEAGDWGIWVMTADGANPRKLIGGVPPVDWAFERLAVIK